ncbi:MAG: signal peptide peptidase SppA, partial [Pirellulales bacterium]|nr:signal peptide peptidase SppA [Pirellulales bacterium]
MKRSNAVLIAVLTLGLVWTSLAPGQADTRKPDPEKAEPKKAESRADDAKKAPDQAVKKEEKKPETKPVVAVFTLDGPIVEKPLQEDFPLAEPGTKTLKELVTRLEKARDDQQVKAVVFLVDEGAVDLAQVEELRQTIDSIKAAGKKVYAHVDALLETRNFALAAGASELSVTPTAIIMITGFSAESPYLRGLLDWIGVKPDFLACGEYKTAAEMFMRKGPSPAAERMQTWLLDSLFQSCLESIAQGRKAPVDQVRQWINEGLYTPEKAKTLRIIDQVEYREAFEARLRAKYGQDLQFKKDYGKQREEEIDLSSPLALFKVWAEILQGGKKKALPKNSVAIVYVDGPIVPGKAEQSVLGGDAGAFSTTIRKALDKAAADENVKAVVLRVNSPGGSAVASEIILNATRQVAAKKPFAVSMGSVAGSGGYYVTCGADTIFADATTITASIGVVGGKLATTDLWNKVGIIWDADHRGANADLLSSEAVFSDDQRKQMQDWMNDIYGVFKGHVAAARGKKLRKPIDELAGGRVFTGRQALDLGLVDKIGTL